MRRITAYTENGIDCPAIILTGSEEGTHRNAFTLIARIPNRELKELPGAGHACQTEQPWLFDRLMIEFLTKHGLHHCTLFTGIGMTFMGEYLIITQTPDGHSHA